MTRGLPALALLAAACAAPPPPPPAGLTPVVWRQATPAATRAADMGACELIATGASPSMTQDQIRAAAMRTEAEDRLERLSACLTARGYTVTEAPVCTPAERAAGQLLILSATDALPPLSRVRCFVPEEGGFVL